MDDKVRPSIRKAVRHVATTCPHTRPRESCGHARDDRHAQAFAAKHGWQAESTPRGWWPRAESNHRHADFQSAALPTELLGHKGHLVPALPSGRERAIRSVWMKKVKPGATRRCCFRQAIVDASGAATGFLLHLPIPRGRPGQGAGGCRPAPVRRQCRRAAWRCRPGCG